MQITQEIITALIGVIAGLTGSVLTYWSQRAKIAIEARSEAEKADDVVFIRLRTELERRDERIDSLEKKITQEIERRIRLETEMSEVRSAFDNERSLRRQLERELAKEKALRITLEHRVSEQAEQIRKQAQQIAELQSENGNLHSQNRELAKRLDTQELKIPKQGE